jgi:hypothetical protein
MSIHPEPHNPASRRHRPARKPAREVPAARGTALATRSSGVVPHIGAVIDHLAKTSNLDQVQIERQAAEAGRLMAGVIRFVLEKSGEAWPLELVADAGVHARDHAG